MSSSESSPPTSANDDTKGATSISGAIAITIAGFFCGLFVTPFKGEIGIALAASVAFGAWLIWTIRSQSVIVRVVIIVVVMLVAIPLIFTFVGYMHERINY